VDQLTLKWVIEKHWMTKTNWFSGHYSKVSNLFDLLIHSSGQQSEQWWKLEGSFQVGSESPEPRRTPNESTGRAMEFLD